MLTKDEQQLARDYHYHGGDLSPVYKYILSPLAQNLVDTFIPSWMAPNVITFAGLVVSMTSSTIALLINPTLSPDATPRWLGVLVGLSVFAYQTLDNMDGKQARKTGTSSALGMFFDHGCDAMNAGVTILAMGAILGTGWTAKLFICYFSSFVPFYFQTWEEYFSGAMILPAFNGPTEGLLMTTGVCFLSAIFGTPFFHQELFRIPDSIPLPDNCMLRELGYPTDTQRSITPFTIQLVMINCCVIPTMTLHVYRVIKHRIEHKGSVAKALSYLTPFVLFFPSAFNYIIRSEIGFKKYPIATALLFATSFAEINMHLMLSHICHMKLQMWKRYPIWLATAVSIFTFLPKNSELYQYETAYLFVASIISVISLISYFNLICFEFCQALNVDVFHIRPKPTAEKKTD